MAQAQSKPAVVLPLSSLQIPRRPTGTDLPEQGCFWDSSERFCWFSDRLWWVRSDSGGPGTGCFSNTEEAVFLNPEGGLHLRMTRSGEKWCQAEIRSVEPARFGRHSFELAQPARLSSSDIVVGMFLYRELPAIDGRCSDNSCAPVAVQDGKMACLCEIDFEITGALEQAPCNTPPQNNPVLFQVVHPGDDSSCRWHPFHGGVPGDLGTWVTTTHTVDWSAERVRFNSYHGYCSVGSCDAGLGSFDFSQGFIPHEREQLQIVINLWLCDRQLSGPNTTTDPALACSGRLKDPYEIVLNSYQFEEGPAQGATE